jgi:DNA-directed RNA polymerase I, II, and III subunit RPABC1
MIEDRHFLVSEEDKNLSYKDFADRFEENQINITATHSKDPNKMVYVSYILDSKTFSKKELLNLKSYIDVTFPLKDISVIIIVSDKPTPQIGKELQSDEFKSYEIFLTKNLMHNVTHHEIVPKHILLTEEEAKKVLDEFQATKSQLPKLLHTDPIAKYYGMKPGDICKIVRNSQMTGESDYYRMVK